MNHSIRHYICFTMYVTVFPCPQFHKNKGNHQPTLMEKKQLINHKAVHPLNMQINHPSAVH